MLMCEAEKFTDKSSLVYEGDKDIADWRMLRQIREDVCGEKKKEMEMSDSRKTGPFCIPAGRRQIATRNKEKNEPCRSFPRQTSPTIIIIR